MAVKNPEMKKRDTKKQLKLQKITAKRAQYEKARKQKQVQSKSKRAASTTK